MTLQELQKLKLPDAPGVYRFLGQGREILYIGKATSLRDRVRSYFSATVATRGRHVETMVKEARTVSWEETQSVLEALVLEAALIKKHHPPANTKEKDNKSFNYLVITTEPYPRILVIRERTMLKDSDAGKRKFAQIFGPFPSGIQLETGLRLIRKIFPFRDTCIPLSGKPCFNAQIGLCPGVCDGRIGKKEYRRTVTHISTFFSGKKRALLSSLKREMDRAAGDMRFEDAGRIKKTIFALEHLNDVALIRDDVRGAAREMASRSEGHARIEAYDVAHLGGKDTVGVMVVIQNGSTVPSQYRKFKIRGQGKDSSNDPLNLREVLERRIGHAEWALPDLIVVDGNSVQKSVAESIVRGKGLSIPIVAVVKDERHKPTDIIGIKSTISRHKKSILLANSEAHRFSVAYHRNLRRRHFLPLARPMRDSRA